ncbi:MAG: right-handed parallel beta-helix repeat-containing protein [Nanoarchaeota archaeon]
MIKKEKVFFAIILLFVLIGIVSAANYYVDKDSIGGVCSDSNAGTSASSPFCTIHKGESVTMPGDTVYIRSGTYFELSGIPLGSGDRGTLNINRGGSPGNPITYTKYPSDPMPNITGNSLTYAVVIGASYITLDSLDVSNGYRGITLAATGSSDITIRNSHIHNVAGSTGGNNNGGILGGIFGGVDYGMFNNVLIENNKIHDNKDPTCFSGTGAGIEFYGLNNSIIRNNHIYNEHGGIWLKSHDSNLKIYNNTIHDVGEGIYHFAQPINIDIFDNVIYSFSENALGSRQSSSTTYLPGQNIRYFNNIVLGDGLHHTFYQVVTNGSKVYNNILYYGNRGLCSAGSEGGELTNRESGTATNFFEGNNLLYHPTDNRHFCWNGVLYTLIGWRSYWDGAGGNPANGDGSIEENPLFISTDPANPNFLRLANNSPVIDNGTFIPGFHCALSDSNGGSNLTDCRHWSGSAPDIGRYEYVSGVAPNSPDVNSDGKVNIIDLVLVIRWQGRNSENIDWNNYKHLDVNNDNRTDISDITVIMGNM